MLKGETISRVRNGLKAVKQDAFLTDRMIYTTVLKYAKLFIKRLDDSNKIAKYQGLFTVLECVDLIDVDKIEACCTGIKSNCRIKRTKDKLPNVIEGSFGAFFRSVTSIDGSFDLRQTFPTQYVKTANSTNFKYNKTLYYWFLNGYLYFPNIEWDAVSVEALFEDEVPENKCDDCNCCITRQNEKAPIPEALMVDIEQAARQELIALINIPEEPEADNKSLLK